MARKFKNDKAVGIGAVDCELEASLCGRMGVNGYPAIKAYVMGKGRSYNGAREAEPMQRWIAQVAANRGSKGGSAKCRAGVFKSKMKHAVVPLCESHFPDDKAKNDWLVFYYDHSATAEMRDALNSAAIELGNYPPDMSKASKKQKKQRERITELAGKHDLKVSLPAKGPFGMDELVKVGGVCCDCDEEHTAFCADSFKQGEDQLKAPQVFWVSKGVRTLINAGDLTKVDSKWITRTVLQRMGVVEKSSEKEEL